jgi:hypothetical protein
MRKSQKLSDLLFNKPAKGKINLSKPIPIGHLLAVNIYDEAIFRDTLFLDHIDVCHSHTVFIFGRACSEILPFNVNFTITNPYSTRVFYQNGVNLEIIRI